MAIHKMKSSAFQQADFDQWKETAVQSLKGKPFETLFTKTPESITLQPLYTAEDFASRLHQARVTKTEEGCLIAQHTFAENGADFIYKTKESITRGNEAVVYDGVKPFSWDEQSLSELADLLISYPIFLFGTKQDDEILQVFDLISAKDRSSVQGAVCIEDWTAPEGFSSLRTNGADLWDAHHQGADAATELALSLSKAAELAAAAADFEQFTKQFFVRFPADTHFFMEIAKFRAFRSLWAAFCLAYDQPLKQVPLLAVTSLRSYSKLDPYVNLLRAGNETFSAYLGGADVMTVYPLDILTGITPASVRLARNTQLVIKEETHVEKVIDPAGGSYFIESLTSELIEKAWQLFLEIDENGGYEAFMKSGQLETIAQNRQAAVQSGKTSLIGTNVYAELKETKFVDGEIGAVPNRLAEEFEKLRFHFQENEPRTVIVSFGLLKDFKPRADFVTGFLATGGIQAEWSPAFTNAGEAAEWLASEKPDYAIVCATPAETEQIMDDLLQKKPDDLLLDAAGSYDEHLEKKWLAKGLNGFIFAGQNKTAKLTEIAKQTKGEAKHEKA